MFPSNNPKTSNVPWYFDGYNTLHAVLLGRERDVPWWHRDYQLRVVTWVESLYEQSPIDGAPVTVVFDAGRPLSDSETVNSPTVSVVYAPSADEWIVATCRRNRVRVVSADRSLTDRAKALGAQIFKPWAFEAKPNVD